MVEIFQVAILLYVVFFALKKREEVVEEIAVEEISAEEFCEWANAQLVEYLYEQDIKVLLSLVEGD